MKPTPLSHPEKFTATILSATETANLIRERACRRFVKEHGIKALANASYNAEIQAFEVA